MRGSYGKNGIIFSRVDPEDRVPKKHPLRLIRAIVKSVLAYLSADFFHLRDCSRLLPQVSLLLSQDHFSVEGTLIDA